MISCRVGDVEVEARIGRYIIYIIILSSVGFRSLYHQEREMRWHMIAHDIKSRRKKDDIPIYHVSPRDMIYCDMDDDTQ